LPDKREKKVTTSLHIILYHWKEKNGKKRNHKYISQFGYAKKIIGRKRR